MAKQALSETVLEPFLKGSDRGLLVPAHDRSPVLAFWKKSFSSGEEGQKTWERLFTAFAY